MNKRLASCSLSGLAVVLVVGVLARSAEKGDPQLAHMVFFTLKDHSKASREQFVASCQKHLTGHKGTASFSVGVIAEGVEEPVSVRDFDVALHVVFQNKAARDLYLEHARHKQFVEENKASFAKVRVFDSYLVDSQ
jgi:Stress responsive A/B Barrel Domain